MYVLGLDTSTDYAICFLSDENARTYHSIAAPHERDLSTRLYSVIGSVLARAGIALPDVDVLAVGFGPGSFTGVRIAVTTMRTLAQVTRKRLVAVSTLAILAESALGLGNATGRNICPLLPSRRNEVYTACFRDGQMQIPDTAASPQQAILGIEEPILAGTRTIIDAVAGAVPAGSLLDFIEVEPLNPASFALLACRQISLGQFQDPLSLDPLYVVAPAVSQHKSISA